jgi:hypothetical protein
MVNQNVQEAFKKFQDKKKIKIQEGTEANTWIHSSPK